ncbi:MAG: ribosomal-processing cysteine protease Prp [Eubacteriales bacterium]
MIEIVGGITADRCEITAAGHAGYAPIGQDIVCAAVSALLCTLSLCDEVEVEQGEGILHLFGEATEQVCYLFRAIAAGIFEIAAQYPANVSIKWGDYKSN